MICERLWKELKIGKIIRRLLAERKCGFDLERAIFLFNPRWRLISSCRASSMEGLLLCTMDCRVIRL